MSRLLVVSFLLASAAVSATAVDGDTAKTVSDSNLLAPTTTPPAPAPAVSACKVPITFMCSNDPTDRVVGPHPKPESGASSSGTGASSLIESAVNAISDLAVGIFDYWSGGGGNDDKNKNKQGRKSGSSAGLFLNPNAASKKANFYAAADSGSECFPLSGALAASTTVYPDPSAMVVSQQDASYFHVFCGDVGDFHKTADDFISAKLQRMGETRDDDGFNPVLKEGEAASARGYFPSRPSADDAESAAVYASEGTKLRSTALLIVPGGAYERLSLYESIVYPLEVLRQQQKQTSSTKSSSSSGDAAEAALTATISGNDFVPIVVQYRVTPPAPESPNEDISKVIRMLERYRQKRPIASLSLPNYAKTSGDAGSSENSENSEEAEPDRMDAEKRLPPPMAGDDVDLGLSEGERKRRRDADQIAQAAKKGDIDGKGPRLSPSMLGLTDDFRIMIVGFSAGGHAAATYLAMTSTIPVAAAVLVYPVVSMEDATIAHADSAMNLLNVDVAAAAPTMPPPQPKTGSVAGDEAEAPPSVVAGEDDGMVGISNGDDDKDGSDTNDNDDDVDGSSIVSAEERFASYQRQQELQRRYSPDNFPSNFPSCTYMAHTETDATVSIAHSRRLFDSLVAHRTRLERSRRKVARIRSVVEGGTSDAAAATGTDQKKQRPDGEEVAAFFPPLVLNVSSSDAKRSIGTLAVSYNVALRTYPKGPHGRWWLSSKYPELRTWWSEALQFLDANNC